MKKSLSVIVLFLAFGLFSFARIVKGTVRCQDLDLSGVVISDGTNFTTTKTDGTFRFNIEKDARFVYVVTPSGYTADFSSGSPCFYRKAKGRKVFDFNLVKTTGSKDFTLFSVSDPQPKNDGMFAQFTGKPLQDLISESKKYSAKGLTVGIALGDICWDAPQYYPAYKAAIAKTGIPFYAVIGNHDNNRKTDDSSKCPDNFENSFGPVNYAFFIGDAAVIAVDDIIYKGHGKYKEGYTDAVLAWVEGFLKYVPEDTHIFIAQHSPLYLLSRKIYIANAKKMLAILKGRKVDFLSGHTHVQDNMVYSPDIMEHNAPSLCGAFWKCTWCRDGSPRGYEVFSSKNGELSWFLHPIDYPDDFQIEIINPGQSKFHPNCVVANIWDYDENWSVEWYQDGKYKGKMQQVSDMSPTYLRGPSGIPKEDGLNLPASKRSKPRLSSHYFAAEPDMYAKNVTVVVKNRFGKEWKYDVDLSKCLDVQAHRGGAGLKPENTFNSMINAVKLGVNTLEMDLQLSKDMKVVISHDSYFNARYATRPDGSLVMPGDPKEYLYTMPYDSIAKYDVGMRPNTVWPHQAKEPAVKPLASALIDSVERFTAENGYSPMRYNIEIKSKAGKGEGKNWPDYKTFVDTCIKLLLSKNLGDRLVVQCFDTRALDYMHEKYPQLHLSYLVSRKNKDFDTYMSKLSFVPVWLSPESSMVDKALVEKCHSEGIRVVPWTVDNMADMRYMLNCGVDAIISNYPDRMLQITRGY
ncbi:MAG: calcineurin-like phosphoesterase C-terminal domain-containing protein [Bacteroidales bacterium]|jgi:glycerophosphoryl diester phosphodiesterase|nr:calcineurin-like phosphoesterase C-terminal domain-containing protein [Bacteroidales bacterium]